MDHFKKDGDQKGKRWGYEREGKVRREKRRKREYKEEKGRN